jgi:hypothetical protein
MKKITILFSIIFLLSLVFALTDESIDTNNNLNSSNLSSISDVDYKAFTSGLKSQFDSESVKTVLPNYLNPVASLFGITSEDDIYLENFLIYMLLVIGIITICIQLCKLIPFFEKSWTAGLAGFVIAFFGIRGGAALYMYNYIMNGVEQTFELFSSKKLIFIITLIVIIIISLRILNKILKKIKNKGEIENAQLKGLNTQVANAINKKMIDEAKQESDLYKI